MPTSTSSPPRYQLFVGVDIAAQTFTTVWIPPDASPGRPVTLDQTPQGFAALQACLLTCAGSYIEDRSHDDGENAVLAAAETAQGRLSPIVAGRHESGPYGVALTTDHEHRRPPTPGSLPYRLAS